MPPVFAAAVLSFFIFLWEIMNGKPTQNYEEDLITYQKRVENHLTWKICSGWSFVIYTL